MSNMTVEEINKIAIEKLAMELVNILWMGYESSPNDSSMRNMTKEEYYKLNRNTWDIKAEAISEHFYSLGKSEEQKIGEINAFRDAIDIIVDNEGSKAIEIIQRRIIELRNPIGG